MVVHSRCCTKHINTICKRCRIKQYVQVTSEKLRKRKDITIEVLVATEFNKIFSGREQGQHNKPRQSAKVRMVWSY